MLNFLAVASESEEFFTELLFGSGAFLGLLLIIGFMLMLVVLVKYSTIVLVPFAVLMIVLYLQNVSVNSNFMWSSVLMFFCIILMFVVEAKRK